MNSKTIRAAMSRLYPTGGWVAEDTYDSIVMDEGLAKPSQADIEAAWQEHQAYEAANQYKRERLVAYPSVGEQLDALWKGMAAMVDAGQDVGAEARAMLTEVKAVKARIPKPKA